MSKVPGWLWVWAILTAVMLWVRPALPIDETRYLAAAWEMWWRDSVAVPYLNGQYYDGKPPLFFWLMHLGWMVSGVNEWWPRLISPASGLASLFLLRATAARLWGPAAGSGIAPWILLGSFLWAGFCASTMFDVLLGFFALSSVYALVRAWRGETGFFAVAGLALGLGILAKGPVVFLPALFIVLLAPWWTTEPGPWRASWRGWYLGALGATGIAALVALAWLVPMASGSDLGYLLNMTVKQTAGYTVNSFSHASPFWWYLPLLPLLLFPWSLWPRAWRAIGATGRAWGDSGVRLCVVWIVAVFLAFSLISGKRAHYLLLFFPAVALLLGRLLPLVEAERDRTLWLPGLSYVAAGSALIACAAGIVVPRGVPWLSAASATPLYAGGLLLAVLGVAVALQRSGNLVQRVGVLSAANCATMLALGWTFMNATSGAYDVRPMSEFLSELDRRGAPLAAITRYDGQYNFYGRRRAQVEIILAERALDWARAHPGGYVLSYQRAGGHSPGGLPAPARADRYRGGTMTVWPAAGILAHPEIVHSFE